jgi:hypothetical protein
MSPTCRFHVVTLVRVSRGRLPRAFGLKSPEFAAALTVSRFRPRLRFAVGKACTSTQGVRRSL